MATTAEQRGGQAPPTQFDWVMERLVKELWWAGNNDPARVHRFLRRYLAGLNRRLARPANVAEQRVVWSRLSRVFPDGVAAREK